MTARRSLPFLVLLTSLHLGCGKCKERDMDRKDYIPEAHRYFDVLKAGNSWLFVNRTGLEDSVWVEAYTESEKLSFSSCIKYPERRLKLVSNQLPLAHQVIYSSTTAMTIFSIEGDFSVS
jgi:type II secretory pathway component PulL